MNEQVKKFLDQAVEELKAKVEVEIEKLINDKCDGAVDAGLKKLEEAAKMNPLVVGILESSKPKIKEEMKKFLLGQAEKISDKV